MDRKKLAAAVATYLADLGEIRASGAATGERSNYPPLANLLNTVGAMLKPKVVCIAELADSGAGHPDFGLYAAGQLRGSGPKKEQLPAHGVVEVKSAAEGVMAPAVREQAQRYRSRYGLVLATNLREFTLLGRDATGDDATLESFQLADSEAVFNHILDRASGIPSNVAIAFGEYLVRVLSNQAVITNTKDLAWLLASYARDGLARVEASADSPALRHLRSALEEALGVHFKGPRGTRFFHSTLVQTLFYGVFSAWVLWSRQKGPSLGSFRWREANWHLRVPVLRALFSQLSEPGRLKSLGLVELLDWTANALDRVDRAAFFQRFNEKEAVPYFYEPFLEAFDLDLRKALGVWYTPAEVVRYMVARVDRSLKDDLGLPDGLASSNVIVLDPCCGTGAFLAEVLRRIATNLESKGLGALAGAELKRAATERVFGFEIMPAPFVVSHLQVDLTMQDLDASLSGEAGERPSIFLTNALTGWEPVEQEPLLIQELEEERDRAGKVKQEAPILVIIGNPPYNGFAGMAVDEERELSKAYRTTKRVPKPQGQGLNDLYVRFFRMAERRIVGKTGQGVVCFISNYSWLTDLSFPGMRERYMEVFDTIRIDNLNGDKRKTGKLAPDGSPDPSIFSTRGDPVGIQVGTAIATLVRQTDHKPCSEVEIRELWGERKREELSDTADTEPETLYERITPNPGLGLTFAKTTVSEAWFEWPSLPELFPKSFPGVKTSRDTFLVDVDRDRLTARVGDYFNRSLTHEEIARRYPAVMKSTARFDATAVRDALLARGGPNEDGFIRYAYRPFDTRWLYWEADTKLLDEKRADYRTHAFVGNLWISAARHLRRGGLEPQACVTQQMASLHLIERGASMFPAWLRDDGLPIGRVGTGPGIPNLSAKARRYLDGLGADTRDLYHYVIATLHDPAYREANADALRMGWPRVPLPGWPKGTARDATVFRGVADRGLRLTHLFDAGQNTSAGAPGPSYPHISATIAVPATTADRNMAGSDFEVTAGWGHYGATEAVMPGQGRVEERSFTAEERNALGNAVDILGPTTFDVYLNDRAFWCNVPRAAWSYRLGGYQVLKKWLSYREGKVLNRPLTENEVSYFSDVARRISAVLVMSHT